MNFTQCEYVAIHKIEKNNTGIWLKGTRRMQKGVVKCKKEHLPPGHPDLPKDFYDIHLAASSLYKAVSQTALSDPSNNVGVLGWVRDGYRINRPTNSRVLQIDNSAYYIMTYNDIHGNSAGGLKRIRNGRVMLFGVEVDKENCTYIIDSIAKHLSYWSDWAEQNKDSLTK